MQSLRFAGGAFRGPDLIRGRCGKIVFERMADIETVIICVCSCGVSLLSSVSDVHCTVK